MDETNSKSGVITAEPPKKRPKQKKKVRRIVTISVSVIVVLGIVISLLQLFDVVHLFGKKDDKNKQLLTDVVSRGSIQSTVTGSGLTKAKDAATITLASGGKVLEVFVKDGDVVKKGDPLYTIDSTDAATAVQDAQKQVDNDRKQLSKIYEAANYLTISADYSGILINAADIKVGDTVATGAKVGTLVDDSKMKLVLYFNYAYINDIKVGQTAGISIPSTMNQLTGTVSEVNLVKKVTAEGSKLFQIVVIVNNPGILTADMGATATLVSSSGETIDPYEAGKLAYFKTIDIVTKVSGKAAIVNLLNFQQVNKGAVLLKIDAEDNSDEVARLESQLKNDQDKLEKAQKNLDNFNPVAPMDGTVLSCTLKPGEQVEANRVAISVADTSVMTVEARIDEMNVSYVKAGMPVTITQYGRNGQETFMGTVESMSMEGKNENGFSYFPATVRVDNPAGTLMTGMYVDYSMIASQSDNCLMVPVQAVKYTDSGTCLYIKADSKPDNALDAAALGLDVPEGFFAVPIKVGLSDSSSAEILEGVTEGTEVFTQYMTDNGNSMTGGMGGGMVFSKG